MLLRSVIKELIPLCPPIFKYTVFLMGTKSSPPPWLYQCLSAPVTQSCHASWSECSSAVHIHSASQFHLALCREESWACLLTLGSTLGGLQAASVTGVHHSTWDGTRGHPWAAAPASHLMKPTTEEETIPWLAKRVEVQVLKCNFLKQIASLFLCMVSKSRNVLTMSISVMF